MVTLLVYACALQNVTASHALDGITPIQAHTGQVADISHFLHFCFWEPVYYNADENKPDHKFPSQSNDKRGHWVDVKRCGKLKARVVADGHLTKDPNETVYSGVVSLRNLRLAMALAELNDLQLWGADAGNVYLQAFTKEKHYIVAGPEFEELQGHVLDMFKVLYGTKSVGGCWHDKLFDIFQQMGF